MQKLLTQRDVAKMLGISSDRIREYNTHAGLLEYVALPGLNKAQIHGRVRRNLPGMAPTSSPPVNLGRNR